VRLYWPSFSCKEFSGMQHDSLETCCHVRRHQDDCCWFSALCVQPSCLRQSLAAHNFLSAEPLIPAAGWTDRAVPPRLFNMPDQPVPCPHSSCHSYLSAHLRRYHSCQHSVPEECRAECLQVAFRWASLASSARHYRSTPITAAACL
jgi:hypothetical protein